MANRFLNNIRVNDSYTLPADDGSDGQAIITDGSGNLSFGAVAAASADNAEAIHLEVKNTSGATINKGTPVYITGNVGNTDKLEIAPADASDASKMPAVGLLETTLSNNSEGYVAQGGYLKGLATATIDGTSTSPNDTVYVKAGGGLTMTKPTGTNYIQNVAKVARVNASNGSFVVSSILRTNDVPTPLYIDHTNQRLGIGTTTPGEKLDVNGNVNITGDVIVGNNLIVNGTTTTLNTTTVEVEDNILQLNTTQGTPDTATAATSGISIYRGDGITQASLIFDDADDTWDLTNNLVIGGNISTSGTLSAGATTISGLTIGATEVTSTAAELNILDGATLTTAELNYVNGVTSNIQTQLDSKQASGNYLPLTGGTLSGTLTIEKGSGSIDALVIKGYNPTISLLDDDGGDDFYIYVNGNNFYVLANRDGNDLVGTGWEGPHPLQLEADTNTGYLFGSRMFTDNYHPNADKWTTARTLTLGGDLTGNVSIDGSANVTLNASLDLNANDAIALPTGTTAERPSSPAAGMFRYNTDDDQFEGYTTEWGAIAGSGGGGSAVLNTSNNLVGDGSTVVFALGGTPGNANDVIVFLNGVYQEKSNYSISGSNIAFTTAPPNGYSIEVKYVTGALDLATVGEVTLREYVGDGNTSTYVLGTTPTSEVYVDAYIDGVYQEKGTYSVAGSNIVFDSNIPNGASIELKTTGTIPNSSVTQTTFVSDEFTADGSTNNFTLVNGSPSSKSLTMVFIQGVYQAKSNYNLVSNEIQFTAGTPAENDVIEVISMSAINTVNSSVTSVNGEVGAVTVQSKHGVSVISANTNAVANTVYVFTASLTLTLPASPEVGDSIKISNLSGVDTCVLGSNGNKIMDAAEDLTLDTASASFELIWSGSSKGWVIIGQ